MSERVFVVGSVRTAIGRFGGALAQHSPVELASIVFSEAFRRAGINPEQVDEVILGNVLGAGHGMNLGRQAARAAGVPDETPAYTVNKVCGSGLKAITLGAAEIALGRADVVIAGGVESMSQAGFISRDPRFGKKMGHMEFADLMLQDGLTDAFSGAHMGITAENLAKKYDLSRSEQDAFAFESVQRALASIEQKRFANEIVPVPLKGKQKGTEFAVDEHPRKDTSLEKLSQLRPAFDPEGSVTAGNSSGINDGAAALVLVSEKMLTELSPEFAVELVDWASAGVDPDIMGIGPVHAVRRLLGQQGVSLEDIEEVEANEAFAAQSLAVLKLLELSPERVNTWGGAIALGHPIGASGARVSVTLLSRMKNSGAKQGLATLCIGGGQGIAALFRRVSS